MKKLGTMGLLAFVAVALIQTGFVGWMVWDRVQLLENGREIVLPIVPVDPRSLFRGDYVVLSYDISRLKGKTLAREAKYERDEPVYLLLKQDKEKIWQPESLSRVRPDDTDGVVLQGRVRYNWNAKNSNDLWMRYGIEAYFVPEGEGKRLEKLVGEKKLAALVAVADDGEAAIKGLMIDGQLEYAEPLF